MPPEVNYYIYYDDNDQNMDNQNLDGLKRKHNNNKRIGNFSRPHHHGHEDRTLKPPISHTHYNDTFNMAELKSKFRLIGPNELVRVKREIGEAYDGPDLPRFAGILDRQPPPNFRTFGFTTITLNSFTIVSTGTTGKRAAALLSLFNLPNV